MSTTTLKPSTPSGVRDLPSLGEMLRELLPLVGAIVVAGPPVVLLLAPLVLGALMLAGPFLLAVTVLLFAVAASVVAASLVALARAAVTASHVLGHRVREDLRRHPRAGTRPGHLATVKSGHVPA